MAQPPADLDGYLDRRDTGVTTVLLLPSLVADFATVAYTSDGRPRCRYATPTAAVATFLRSVRGLPLDDLTVEAPCGIFKIKVSDSTGFPAVKVPKCNPSLTKKPIFLGNEPIYVTPVTDTSSGKILNLYPCADASAVNPELLRAMTFSREAEPVVGGVAYSRGDGVAIATAHLITAPEEALLTVASAIRTCSRAARVAVGDSRFVFSRTEQGDTVSDPAPTVRTLFTPAP